jgi:hypothetical protein
LASGFARNKKDLADVAVKQESIKLVERCQEEKPVQPDSDTTPKTWSATQANKPSIWKESAQGLPRCIPEHGKKARAVGLLSHDVKRRPSGASEQP